MKSSISALILAIIGTLYAPAMDSAELRSLSPIRDFLIDSSKPYVYLEIDHIGREHLATSTSRIQESICG